MFLYAIILAIILGYIFKGNLKNLGMCKIYGIYFIFAGFFIDAASHFAIIYGFLKVGTITYICNILLYIFVFTFIYINRKNIYLVIMGIGFLLNAVVILVNGGAMPVGYKATVIAGISDNVGTEGLYRLANASTKFKFLGDMIAFSFFKGYAFSIGDVIAAIGIILFIIFAMRGKFNAPRINHTRGRRSRLRRRLRRDSKKLTIQG